jgi:hypothetical protein
MALPVGDDTLDFNPESASSRAQPNDLRRSNRNRVSPSWHKDYHMTLCGGGRECGGRVFCYARTNIVYLLNSDICC